MYRDGVKRKGDKIGMVLFICNLYVHNFKVVSEITLPNKLSNFGTTHNYAHINYM